MLLPLDPSLRLQHVLGVAWRLLSFALPLVDDLVVIKQQAKSDGYVVPMWPVGVEYIVHSVISSDCIEDLRVAGSFIDQ